MAYSAIFVFVTVLISSSAQAGDGLSSHLAWPRSIVLGICSMLLKHSTSKVSFFLENHQVITKCTSLLQRKHISPLLGEHLGIVNFFVLMLNWGM